MPGTAAKIPLSEKQQGILQELRRSRTVSRCVVQRATIILRGFQRRLNPAIAEEVKLNRQQVGVGRQRWREAWESLCVWECREPQRLREAILDVLSDAPRPGAPPTFTADQVARIGALACEPPKLSGRPISHWTLDELRDEVLQRNIVTTISRAQVGRFLQHAALQPHRKKRWLNTTEKDTETFQREVENVGNTYLEAPQKAAANGTHTVSVDEATSLQALERNAPDKPAQPGQRTKPEFEYTRHGTTTLTAGLDVVTGQIVSPTLEPTRTEPEFVPHIARTVSSDTDGEWVIVVDCLNTPLSESRVIWTAARCGVLDALGNKRLRHPQIHGHSQGVLVGPLASPPICLPAETPFLAQSTGDYFRDHASQAAAGRKFRLGGRPGIATPSVPELLQHHNGPPLRVDRHWNADPKSQPPPIRPAASSR